MNRNQLQRSGLMPGFEPQRTSLKSRYEEQQVTPRPRRRDRRLGCRPVPHERIAASCSVKAQLVKQCKKQLRLARFSIISPVALAR